jgi:hypothetical protein
MASATDEYSDEHSMAYAIFLKKTKKVDYDYKYLDIKKWKLYTPYNMLKLTPKLSLSDTSSITCSTSDNLNRGRGPKKGNKAAKKEQGEMKRKAFRDAERDRRLKRVVQKEDDACCEYAVASPQIDPCASAHPLYSHACELFDQLEEWMRHHHLLFERMTEMHAHDHHESQLGLLFER